MKLLLITATGFNRDQDEVETATRLYDPVECDTPLEEVIQEVAEEAREAFETSYYGLVGIVVQKCWVTISEPRVVSAQTGGVVIEEDLEAKADTVVKIA